MIDLRSAVLTVFLAFGFLTALAAAGGASSAPIRIAIAGDSTVADYATDDPHRGWGQLLPEFVDPHRAAVQNFAVNGRSTKTFQSEGRWATLLATRPAYVFIQFGHNDSHGAGHPEATDADTDYSQYLRGFVDSARAAGAVPILVTPMHRGLWDPDGVHLTQELLPYAAAMRRVAHEKGVPLVDLYALSEAAFEKIGKDHLDALFALPAQDHTHFNAAGARLLAGLVATETARLAPALRPALIVPPPRTDVVYGHARGQALTLDAYVPDGQGPFPVVVMVHGGGWSGGDKATNITPLFGPLTAAHLVTFSINYRLAPRSRWPACLDDVRTAIRWAKAHAAEYGGDPKRVALVGYSAGAHLATLAAVTAGPDTGVQAVAGLAAPTDLVADTRRRGGLSKSLQALLGRATVDAPTRALLADMSAINHVHRGLPPFLLLHGTADQSVPYAQSLDFQTRLTQSGVPCRFITIPNAPHDIAQWSALAPGYGTQLAAWLQLVLGGQNTKPL